MDESPKLRRVVRLDSIPLQKAYYTEEGYLRDRPVLTSTGIFEYTNPDGSTRRELRLPEDVFAKESLASYKSKPIIITHDAGLVTKDNVHENQVGTILSEGIRDGDDVRADIVIHDTDEMKDRGYKELSLGYNLDLEETPGEWQGEHYDAIQRNIIINHLALVREARAGEQARLNIDSRDSDTLQGGKRLMKKNPKTVRGDGILSKAELEQAIKEYKARRAKEGEDKDAEQPVASEPAKTPEKPVAPAPKKEAPAPVKPTKEEQPEFDKDAEAVETEEETGVEEKLQKVKDRRNERDEEGDPKSKLQAYGMIAHQDEDIDTLFDIIDTLLAEREFYKKGQPVQKDSAEEEPVEAEEEEFEVEENEDGESEDTEETEETEETEDESDFEDDEDWEEDECDESGDDDDWEEDEDDDDDDEEVEEEDEEWEDEEFATDSHDAAIPDSTGEVRHVKKLNNDSVDAVIRQRIALGMVGRKLNMDGLENMGIMAAKKRIIRAVRPSIRLDGKSNAYINAAYDCAVDELKKRTHKGVSYQKKQMFNKDAKASNPEAGRSSIDARKKMIDRQVNRNKN